MFGNSCDDSTLPDAIRSWTRGERDGYAVVYRRFYGPVREIVRLRIGSKLRAYVESVDVVQEVFLGVLRSGPPPGLRATEADVLRVLARATVNRLRDLFRYHSREKRGARIKSGHRACQELDCLPAPAPTPSQVSMGREAYCRYLAAVERLGPRAREAIILARHEGLSMKDCAERMGLGSAAAFRTLLSRSLAKVALAVETDD